MLDSWILGFDKVYKDKIMDDKLNKKNEASRGIRRFRGWGVFRNMKYFLINEF